MKVWAVRVYWAYEYDDVVSLWTTEEAAHKEKARLEADKRNTCYDEYSVQEYEVKEAHGKPNTLSSTQES